MEEEALKDSTSQIEAQVPVNVAAYLLNEKRKAIRVIETRHNVDVVIVPNVNLDTPHYEVIRHRSDDTTNLATFDLVKQTDTDEQYESRLLKSSISKNEPVLKGISAPAATPPTTEVKVETEAAPAPVAKTKAKPAKAEPKEQKPSLLSRILKVAKKLFIEEIEPAVETPKPRNNPNSRNRNRNRNRNTSHNKRVDENENSNKPADDNEGSTTKPRNNRRNKSRKPRHAAKSTETTETVAAEDSAAPTEAKASEGKVAKRRQRRNNMRKKVRTGAAVETEENTVVDADKQDTPVTNTDVKATENETVDTNESDSQEPRRNRRSPRHLRSSGQRRPRQERSSDDSKPAYPIKTTDELALEL
jgi:ribonuclease E